MAMTQLWKLTRSSDDSITYADDENQMRELLSKAIEDMSTAGQSCRITIDSVEVELDAGTAELLGGPWGVLMEAIE